MSIWLILTPVIAWATAGLTGWLLLRTPPERIWHGAQLTTHRIPYDPAQHRIVAVTIRAFGGVFLAIPIFLTLMSVLVVAGVVSPAKN